MGLFSCGSRGDDRKLWHFRLLRSGNEKLCDKGPSLHSMFQC